MIKAKKINNSSLKTKNTIKKNFEELLYEKKDLNSITVSEICKSSDINRGTFYLHYDNLYSVAEEYELDFIDSLNLESISNFINLEDIYYFLENVIDSIKAKENL